MTVTQLEPVREDLTAWRGGTFAVKFKLWADQAKTVPYAIEGAVQIEIAGVKTLTEGSGLTVNAAAGTIEAVMSVAETEATTQWQDAHYVVSITNEAGERVFPVRGTITFTDP